LLEEEQCLIILVFGHQDSRCKLLRLGLGLSLYHHPLLNTWLWLVAAVVEVLLAVVVALVVLGRLQDYPFLLGLQLQ
jgi:hypothetical protein